jgi:hypothetical protein
MPEYRAYSVGEDGGFTGFEPLVCADDAEAIKDSFATPWCRALERTQAGKLDPQTISQRRHP